MARIIIRMEINDRDADPEDHSGVTSEMFDSLFAALSPWGDDIDIQPDD